MLRVSIAARKHPLGDQHEQAHDVDRCRGDEGYQNSVVELEPATTESGEQNAPHDTTKPSHYKPVNPASVRNPEVVVLLYLYELILKDFDVKPNPVLLKINAQISSLFGGDFLRGSISLGRFSDTPGQFFFLRCHLWAETSSE